MSSQDWGSSKPSNKALPIVLLALFSIVMIVTLHGCGEEDTVTQPQSSCSISTTYLNCGTVNVGSSVDRTFTITNSGGGTLTGSVGESCLHYSIVSGGGSYSLGAGQTRTVTVRFTPTTSGTLTCSVSTGTSCSSVSCTGYVPPIIDCQVSPTSLDFGNVNAGSSADRTFTITNSGGGTLTGSVSESCSHYSIVSGGGSYSLGAGQSRTVTVRFEPTTSGTFTCNVSTGTSCSSVGCTGVGLIDSQCQVSPTSLDFGTVNVGSSTDRTFTITNTGGGTLTGSVSESYAHYSIISGGGSYSLGAGQSRSVTVRFSPTSTGTISCTVSTGTSCADVSCSGHAIEPTQCQVSPTSLDFGTVNVGSSTFRTFTITNTGGGTLTGSVSESCSHYSIISGSGSYSLSEGQSRTVTVRFAPTSSGTKTCSVSTGTSCSSVSCSGYAPEPPQCQVSPTSLDFGTVNVGSSTDRTFTITNTGGGTLTGSVSESCSHYSIISGSGSYSLSEGQSRTVTVRFAPTSSGTKTCSVSTGTSCSSVSCSGYAPEPPQCQVSPTSLDFGTVNVGSSTDRTFTITNSGGGTLTGSVSESCSHYSIVSGGGSYSLGAGQSRTVTVRFAPTSSGTKTCSVSTGTSCSNVSCSGQGVTPTETAYYEFYVLSGGWALLSTNILSHGDFGVYYNDAFNHEIGTRSWYNCGGSAEILNNTAVNSDISFFFTEHGLLHDMGIDVNSSCTSIKVTVMADKEQPGDYYMGVYVETDDPDANRRHLDIGTSCDSDYCIIPRAEFYFDHPLEINIGHDVCSTLCVDDAAIKSVKIEFIGWTVPVSYAPQGAIPLKVISSE